MRKFYAFLLMLIVSLSVYATDYTFSGTGNYTTTGNWSPSYPGTTIGIGDKVIIAVGANVTIDATVQVNGEYENNGTTTLTSRIYVRSGGILTQNGSCAGSYSQLLVLGGGTVECVSNGGSIPSAARFYEGSYLIFSGITTTAPTLVAGDQFGYLEFDCPSLTTEIDLPYLDIQNDLDITNTGSGSVNFIANTNDTDVAGDLTIGASGTLIIEPGAKLTVNGTLTNSSGTNGLIMQSNSTTTHTGSLIANQDVPGTVQRYLGADRWYMFGPATTGSSSSDVSGSYLQYYTEATNGWTYVTAANYNFSEGTGYAYYGTSNNTITFSGTLYNSNVTFSNLSLYDEGWHILSNPYSSALIWGSPEWSLTDISGTAKVYNGSDWVDRNAGLPIASCQGFAVQASSSTNSLTIPASAKAHNSQDYLKNVQKSSGLLVFSLTDNETEAKDIFYLRSYVDATDDYDLAYDSREFMSDEPSTGKLFAELNGDKLSTLAIPTITEDKSYDLGFVAGTASSYNIQLDEFDFESYEVILEDKFEDILMSMSLGDIYSFDNTSNDQSRFTIHLKNANGVSEVNSIIGVNVWNYNNSVYIQNEEQKNIHIDVYNISGQLIDSYKNINDQFYVFDINEPKGVYLVKVSHNDQIETKPIIK